MAMENRSPPVMPPPVLTITASSASPAALGKRTRSEPSSCTRARRVTPPAAATASAMWPVARLAAKVCARSSLASITRPAVMPREGWHPVNTKASAYAIGRGVLGPRFRGDDAGPSYRQRAFERAFVHAVTLAGIDDGAALHHQQMVAQFLREVQILLDQNDRHLLQVA